MAKVREPKMEVSDKKDKCFIEYYDGNTEKKYQDTPIEFVCENDSEGRPICGVFIGKCNKCTVLIKGKSKNVTISGCNDMSVLVDNCVTTIEIVNCKKVNVQAAEACGTFTVDKSDRCKLYLADGSCKGELSTLVFTSASTSSNVYFSTADGEDQVEYAVPERFLTTIKIGKPAETKVDQEIEMQSR